MRELEADLVGLFIRLEGRFGIALEITLRRTLFSSSEQARRGGRPPLGDEPRQLIAFRADTGVLDELRKEARRRRVGYQTLVNEVLARHVRQNVA